MTEIKYPKFSTYQLTKDVIKTPALGEQPELEGKVPSNSVLFDSRLDDLLRKYSGLFDCVIISHVPLSLQGEDVSQEDHETRCWSRGEGHYTDSTVPRLDEMKLFLTEYLSLIQEIHNRGESLLFHPYFFDQNQFGKRSAPQITQTRLLRHEYQKNTFVNPILEQNDQVRLVASRGYHHTETIGLFERRDLEQVADLVGERISKKKIGMQEDVKACMLSQHELIHNQMCWHTYGDSGGRHNSSYFVSTTSLLSRREESTDKKIAPGVAGMFWLALVGHKTNWGKQEELAAKEILRTSWLLLITEHLTRMQEAERQRVLSDFISSAAHDLQYLTRGIDKDAAPQVYGLIRNYLDQLVTHTKVTIATPEEPHHTRTSFPLHETCITTSKKAARVEKIVELARKHKLHDVKAVTDGLNEIDQWINQRLADSWSELPAVSFALSSRQYQAFELALIAGFRNAIQHCLSTDPQGSLLKVSVQEREGQPLVIIENTLRRNSKNPVNQGKQNGTWGSLRTYARAYGREPRGASVRRVKSDPQPDFGVTEIWETTIPLPEVA